MIKSFITSLIAFLSIFNTVNSQKPHYSEKDYLLNLDTFAAPVQHTVFLIGDGGATSKIEYSGVNLLNDHLKTASKNSTVVYLGDNVYSHGLPPDDGSEERINAEKNLNEQIDATKGFDGNVVFIPGNHDWNLWSKGGWEYVEREEAYVEKRLNKGNTFLPDGACPGPVEVKLSDDVILIVVDTQWWLHKWEKPRGKKDGCKVSSEAELIQRLKNIIDNNADKQILITAHHPIISNGSHGGFTSWKEHLFPFSIKKPKIYLPLPIVGSIFPLYRKFISHRQDIGNPRYTLMKNAFLEAFKNHPNLIYAAGHDHNLQYFQKERFHHIVSGSACKTKYLKKGNGAKFTYEQQGYSKLSYLENGDAWLEFWAVKSTKEPSEELVYREKIIKGIIQAPDSVEYDFRDSTITLAADDKFEAGKIKRLFLGDHYRDAWLTPVEVPLIDLKTVEGGLTPVKLGGGKQTKSLRLENDIGDQFVLRSIKKDPTKTLDSDLMDTWIGDFVNDQVSMAHPYGAFVIAPLAEAAGIYHKKSKLVYVPDDPQLGKFRDIYKNTLALFEQRANRDLTDVSNFGFADEGVSTTELLEDIHKSNDNLVDEKNVLINRLFDIWVGDWDRHEDQWRWARFDCDGENKVCNEIKGYTSNDGDVYRPIPRDRDQVFDKIDGIVPWLATRDWGMPKMYSFNHKIKRIDNLTINGRSFDRKFLTRLTEKQWIDISTELQQNLSDEVINNAIQQFPEQIYKLNGEEITSKLKQRRDDIVKYAKEYYNLLAEEVEVLGSDKKELFEIVRMQNGNTSVNVYRKSKDDEQKNLFYSREFKKSETKEIRIYGFGNDDKFHVTGSGKQGILVRLIGGDGADEVFDNSQVDGIRKKTMVYDTEGTKIQGGSETKEKLKKESDVNLYTDERFVEDKIIPVPAYGFNVDDGLFLGLGAIIQKHDWRKKPRSIDLTIKGAKALKTDAYSFLAQGNLFNLFGKNDLHIDVRILSPNGNTNFYGLGNETKVLNSNPSFYNYRFNQANIFIASQRRISKAKTFRIGPLYQFVNVKPENDKFISSPSSNLDNVAFDAASLLGLQFQYNYNTVNSETAPTKGIFWETSGNYLYNSAYKRGNSKLESQLGIFISGNMKIKPTLAVRFGGSTILGEYAFYQAGSLGGRTLNINQGNLRGYRRFRFSGRSVLFNNIDLRIKLVSFRTYLFPSSLGILTYLDNGKVFIENENSSKWHGSYGGGVWATPFKRSVISAIYQISNEENLFNVNMSFLF